MSDSIIRVKNLSFSYPDGRQALDGVSFEVSRGEKVAIVGRNGAGKSTLLLHLNGTLGARDGGHVLVAGLPVTDRTVRAVRGRVGLVFQDPDDQLFCPTVLDDVAFGPLHMGLSETDIRQRVTRALAAVGMSGYEEHTPHHLSLGERKRIAIATVLTMEPEILILDEPSAGLDPQARRNLIRLLRDLSQTMLAASHDMRLVWELCARTVILDGGQIVADGPTVELLQNHALMECHGLESPHLLGPSVEAHRVCSFGSRGMAKEPVA